MIAGHPTFLDGVKLFGMREEKLDLFVFRHDDVSRENLATATYYRPLDLLVAELTKTDSAGRFVYHQLRQRHRSGAPSAVRFADSHSMIIEREALISLVGPGN